MKFNFSTSVQRLSVALNGLIDADFKFDKELEKIINENKTISEIVFILRKLSFDKEENLNLLLNDLKKLSDKNFEITIIECPKNILDYLIKNHSKQNIKTIRSFMIPYYCNSCNEEKNQLVNTSCLSLSFNSYKKPLCPTCNKQLTLDITEEEILKIANMLPELDKISDKRNYPRYDISSYDLFLEILYNNTKTKFKILNFSQDGVCVSGSEILSPGITVEYIFNSGFGNHSSKATVVWYSADKILNFTYGLFLEEDALYKLLMMC